MKRFLSLLLALCMCLSIGTSALAATINESTAQSTNTTVTYGVQVGYTITIPSTVTIGADGTGAVDYSVSNALIPAGENLYVTTDSANREDDTFYLTNVDESTVKIPYEIATSGVAWSDDMHTRTMVFPQEELSAGTATRAVTFRLLDDGHYSGTYTDILTTTVAVGYAVYGAYQFPEDYTTIVWPADDDKYLYSNSSWELYERVNVFQSKTNEWYPGFSIEWRNADPNDAGYETLPDGKYRFMSACECTIPEWTSGGSQIYQNTGLYDAGYWGNFEADRLLYFGEEFQLVSKEFYNFIMTNTKPYNWLDYYQPITGRYQMAGDLSLPAGNHQHQVGATVNGQYVILEIMRLDSSGIPTVMFTYDVTESGYVPMLLYFEGIGWVEPAAFSFDDMDSPEVVEAFLASLVPAATPHVVEFNEAIISPSIRDMVMSVLQPARITFMIGGTSYQAEDGMTWGEWVESEYNAGYWFVLGNSIFNGGGAVENVVSTDKIIANTSYTTTTGGSND